MAGRAAARLVLWPHWSLLEQLAIEESLMRAGSGSWVIVSRGTADACVVMSRSAKLEEMVRADAAVDEGVDLIRRFSGGGTVLVDEGVTFTSIVSSAADTGVRFPPEVMRWSADEVFAPALDPSVAPSGGFSLQDHDYAVGDRKVGGNAQAMAGDRWVHHTSWLWDFDPARMARLLPLPKKVPEYRRGRGHDAFLVRLADVWEQSEDGTAGADSTINESDREHFERALLQGMERVFDLTEVSAEEAEEVHRTARTRKSNERVQM